MKSSIIKKHLIQTTIVLLFCLSPILQAAVLQPISGRGLTVGEILPTDVYARSILLQKELELIRLEMGKPHKAVNDITVLATSPREVYFVASALFHQADLFVFEQTRTTESLPIEVEANNVQPYHVWITVNAVYMRILKVKQQLGIKETIKEVATPLSITPSDVIKSLLITNRLIADLLTKKITPADVYQQITVSINNAAQLLGSFENTIRIPETDSFEQRKTPSHVYVRLIKVFNIIREIAQISNLEILDFKVDNMQINKDPSDVFTLAHIITAELVYLQSLNQDTEMAAAAYYPGNKTPSDVFQRVSILEQQMQILLKRVKSNPSWLK